MGHSTTGIFSERRMTAKQFVFVVFFAVVIAINAKPTHSDEGIFLSQAEMDQIMSSLETSNTRSDVFLRALNFPEIRHRSYDRSGRLVKPIFSNLDIYYQKEGIQNCER